MAHTSSVKSYFIFRSLAALILVGGILPSSRAAEAPNDNDKKIAELEKQLAELKSKLAELKKSETTRPITIAGMYLFTCRPLCRAPRPNYGDAACPST